MKICQNIYAIRNGYASQDGYATQYGYATQCHNKTNGYATLKGYVIQDSKKQEKEQNERYATKSGYVAPCVGSLAFAKAILCISALI